MDRETGEGGLERGRGEGPEKRRGEPELRIAFWNVVGLMNKDKEFWRMLKEWQVIVLLETWVDRLKGVGESEGEAA